MSERVKYMTKSEYAKSRGVVPSAVTKAIQSGRIVLIDGKIDPDVADVQWLKNTNPAKRRSNPEMFTSAPVTQPTVPGPADHGPAGEVYNIAAARARKEHFDAHITEMKALRDSGETIDVASVTNSVTRVFAQFREAMESMPDKLAEQIAATSSADAVHELLSNEIDIALQAVASGFENFLAGRNG